MFKYITLFIVFLAPLFAKPSIEGEVEALYWQAFTRPVEYARSGTGQGDQTVFAAKPSFDWGILGRARYLCGPYHVGVEGFYIDSSDQSTISGEEFTIQILRTFTLGGTEASAKLDTTFWSVAAQVGYDLCQARSWGIFGYLVVRYIDYDRKALRQGRGPNPFGAGEARILSNTPESSSAAGPGVGLGARWTLCQWLELKGHLATLAYIGSRSFTADLLVDLPNALFLDQDSRSEKVGFCSPGLDWRIVLSSGWSCLTAFIGYEGHLFFSSVEGFDPNLFENQTRVRTTGYGGLVMGLGFRF